MLLCNHEIWLIFNDRESACFQVITQLSFHSKDLGMHVKFSFGPILNVKSKMFNLISFYKILSYD